MSPAGTFADRAADLGYRAAWAGIRTVPPGITTPVANLLADRALRRRGKGVVQYARNLRRVLTWSEAGPGTVPVTPAELSDTVRRGLRSYARYWLETFRLESMDHAAVAASAEANTVGLHHIRDAVAAGRGVVMALPHSGNWDVAGLMITREFGSLTSVAERLRPESLYDRFVAYRESLGMEILPLTGGHASVSQQLKDRLTAGGIVCLLGDRDLTSSGVPVTFFGEQTRMPAGPAMLAALTGADLVVVHLTYTPDGWHQTVSPPVQLPGSRLAEQVRGGTQLVADGFAANIRATPHDWHMLQPLWIEDLPPERQAALQQRSGGRERR
ncbi:phosphatidylinositol mannoside acyltransferase [Nakamurella sp. YIM 132087]|uniref:Phosphatidylinositol mannoside acyltransferase n=1 Tax=Nakamurella alba TaxID=2665158 RepID=A0A7K1FQG8_9ACTN|nr:phosphatidylinositol mannoside acyltransferase [Nakamurella alba]MTD16381.1 phosphatidylinositol mannoside acyltransferase [Nakamurella alba]